MAGVAIVSSKTGLLQKPQDQMVPPEAVTAHISRFRVRNPLPVRGVTFSFLWGFSRFHGTNREIRD
eukprot:SAG31_NODE_2549_length_5519_cov_2.816605_2_plen_66_part_00